MGAALAGLLVGCGAPARTASGVTATTGAPTATGALASGTGSAGTTTGGTADAGSGGPTAPLCDAIEVSLVVDPTWPGLLPPQRDAVAATLDGLVAQTGAVVRVLVSPGSPTLPEHSCAAELGTADAGPFEWGRDFVPAPGARAALECILDLYDAKGAVEGDGDALWSGLMFPILDRPGWPEPGAVALAMILGKSDDGEGGMYARPGLASEAYLRLAAGSDRRRAAAFAYGAGADELALFPPSIGARSTYADAADATLPEALTAWLPEAVATCATANDPIPPPAGTGCSGIDVLFVVDGSYSMEQEQKALRGVDGPPVFGDFTDALLASLDEVESVRVGVVSSQPGDSALHVSTDAPEVPPGPDTECGLPGGLPYAEAPSPTFAEDFACIAATRADTEEYTALNAAMALEDPANTGFIRPDSVVLIVLISDEDTQEWLDGYTRIEIRERIVAALGGRDDRVFMFAIVGHPGIFEAPHTVCGGPYGSASPGRRITSIVRSFAERGQVWDICAGDFGAAFEAILDGVALTCESLVPEG